MTEFDTFTFKNKSLKKEKKLFCKMFNILQFLRFSKQV